MTPKFGAVVQGTVDEAGQGWLNTAILAGFGQQTQLHAVGDGAPWIAEPVPDKFGQPSSYLVDCYHVGDYLAAASSHGTKEVEPQDWLEAQKPALKTNPHQPVIQALEPYLEADEIEESHAPVRAGHRYLSNRTEPLNYQTAIDKGLLIGSGEIASAHRYVIQERLQRPGAWWKAVPANSMLALRVIRANQPWDDYWMRTKAA